MKIRGKKVTPLTLALLAIIATLAVGMGAIIATKTFNATVTIKAKGALGFYTTSACTVPIGILDFGQVNPGDACPQQTVWVKNEGTVIATLSWLADTFDGVSTDYLTLGTPWSLRYGLMFDCGLWAPTTGTGSGVKTYTLAIGAVKAIALELFIGTGAAPQTVSWITTITASA